MKRIVSILILLLCTSAMLPTQKTAEKLEKNLVSAEGLERAKILSKLANEYYYNYEKKAIECGKQALKLLEKFPDRIVKIDTLNALACANYNLEKYNEALKFLLQSKNLLEPSDKLSTRERIYNVIGSSYRGLSDYSQSMTYLKQALEMAKEMGSNSRIADCLHEIGMVHNFLGNYDQALEHYLKSLEYHFRMKQNKKPRIRDNAHVLNNIGIVYMNMKSYSKALNYYKQSMELVSKLGNPNDISDASNNIGVIFQEKKDYEKALEYYNRSLKIEQELKNESGISISYNNIGEVYAELGDREKALAYYSESIKLSEKIGDKNGISYTLIKMGTLFRHFEEYDKALQKTHRGLNIAKESKAKALIRDALKELSDIHVAMKQFQKAYAFHVKFKGANDNIYNDTASLKIVEMQAKFDIDKKEKEIERLKEKEEYQKKRVRYYSIIGLLLLIIIFVNFIRYRYKKKTDKAIYESEQKYRMLVEQAGDGIAVVQEGIYKFANPQLTKTLGFSHDEIIGIPFEKLVAPEEREKLKIRYAKRLAGEFVENVYETVILNKDGSRVDVEINAAVTLYENRPAIMVFIHDLYKQKQLEAERLKRSKFEAIGILAGGIAHDFNNLLSVILGNIELAKLVVDTKDKLLVMLGKAEKTSMKARDLAKRFLTFSEGGTPLLEKTSIKAVLDEALQLTLSESPVRYELKIPDDLWHVTCDPEQVQQVFTSLILNAVEAMQRKNVVYIKAENCEMAHPHGNLIPGKYVKITVRDTGDGIPSQHLPKIFDPYFSTRKRVAQKGLGFGLAIVYSILQHHNGHIDVESEVDKGTTVTFYLPESQEE